MKQEFMIKLINQLKEEIESLFFETEPVKVLGEVPNAKNDLQAKKNYKSFLELFDDLIHKDTDMFKRIHRCIALVTFLRDVDLNIPKTPNTQMSSKIQESPRRKIVARPNGQVARP